MLFRERNTKPETKPVLKPYTKKIMLLGESGTGKTCLINRLIDDSFDKGQRATIGMDFRTYHTEWSNNIKIHFQLWDTAGQERYESIVNCYYRGAYAFIVVVDMTRRETFQRLDYWLEQIKKNHESNNPPIFLIGNKADLGSVITNDELNDYVNANHLRGFFTASAKTSEGVKE